MSDFDGSGDVLAIGEGWEEVDQDFIISGPGDIDISGLVSRILSQSRLIYDDFIVSQTYRKRLHYIVNQLIPDYLLSDSPQWKLLMELYLKYLDEKVYQNIVNIQNIVNVNYEDLSDDLIEGLYNQYASNLVNEEVLKIETYDKKKFAQIGKYIHNLKGTKLSLECLFNYLSQSQVIRLLDKKVLEYILEEVREDINLLNIDTDPNPKLFIAPFTYNVVTNEIFDDLPKVLKNVHPAGFNYLILFENVLIYSENIIVEPETFAANKMFPYRYDGLYDRMGYHVGATYSYPIQIKPYLYREGFSS